MYDQKLKNTFTKRTKKCTLFIQSTGPAHNPNALLGWLCVYIYAGRFIHSKRKESREINTLWHLHYSTVGPVVMLEFRSRPCQQPSYHVFRGNNSQRWVQTLFLIFPSNAESFPCDTNEALNCHPRGFLHTCITRCQQRAKSITLESARYCDHAARWHKTPAMTRPAVAWWNRGNMGLSRTPQGGKPGVNITPVFGVLEPFLEK